MNYLSKINNSHESEELEMILSNVACDCSCSVILKLIYEEIRSLRKLCFDVLNTVPPQQKEYKECNCMKNGMEACKNFKDNDATRSENMRIDSNVVQEVEPQNTPTLETIQAAQSAMLEVIHNIKDNQSNLKENYHQKQEETHTLIESMELKFTKALQDQSDKFLELLSDQKFTTKTYDENKELIKASLKNVTTRMDSMDLNLTKLKEEQSNKLSKLLIDHTLMAKTYEEKTELIEASLKNVQTGMESMDLKVTQELEGQSDKFLKSLTDHQEVTMKCYEEKQKRIEASLKNVHCGMKSMDLKVTKALEAQNDKFFKSLADHQKVTMQIFEKKQEVQQATLKNLTTKETPSWEQKIDKNESSGVITIADWLDSKQKSMIECIRNLYPEEFFLLFPDCLNFNDSKDIKDILRNNWYLCEVYPFIETSDSILSYMSTLFAHRSIILYKLKDHIQKQELKGRNDLHLK